MLTYLPSNDDVVVCSISGHLSADELRDVTQKLVGAVDRNPKTHLFCEIAGLTGVDFKGWVAQLPPGLSLLGKLERFGRVAVVSDQGWIRLASRIESALLPNISYEIFELSERDRALAWVEGRIETPHGSDLRLIPAKGENVIAFELTGRVSGGAMENAVKEISARMDAIDGPVRMLGRFRNFRMPEARAVLDSDYLRTKLSALRKVERYAVVGGPAWFDNYIGLIAPLLRFDVRHFDAGDEAAAWRWLEAKRAAPLMREALETV
jgi:hypothetical protein